MSQFGRVHGHVCMLEKGEGFTPMSRVERDSNAGLDMQGIFLNQKRFFESANQCRDDLLRTRFIRAGKEHGELVPTEPGNGRSGAHRLSQTLSHLLQQLVAALVTDRVVDFLEAIKVQDQQRCRDVVLACQVCCLLDPPLQQISVREAGQRVVRRLDLQLSIRLSQGVVVDVEVVQLTHGHELAHQHQAHQHHRPNHHPYHQKGISSTTPDEEQEDPHGGYPGIGEQGLPQRRLAGSPFASYCLFGDVLPQLGQHIQGPGGQTQQQVSQRPTQIKQAARRIEAVELLVAVDRIGEGNEREGQEQQEDDRAHRKGVLAHHQQEQAEDQHQGTQRIGGPHELAEHATGSGLDGGTQHEVPAQRHDAGHGDHDIEGYAGAAGQQLALLGQEQDGEQHKGIGPKVAGIGPAGKEHRQVQHILIERPECLPDDIAQECAGK